MYSYENITLSAQEIERIKKRNAAKAIRKYIKKNGVAPSKEEMDSFFVATDEDIERRRRILYSKMAIKQDYPNAIPNDSGIIVDKRPLPPIGFVLEDIECDDKSEWANSALSIFKEGILSGELLDYSYSYIQMVSTVPQKMANISVYFTPMLHHNSSFME